MTSIDLCLCFDLHIHNGECPGDKEGKFTYVSSSDSSVIDCCCITSAVFVKHVKKAFVQDRVESLHMPLEVHIVSRLEENQQENKNMSLEKFVWQNDKAVVFLHCIDSGDFVARFSEACDLFDTDIDGGLKIVTYSILEAGFCMRKTIKITRVQSSQWYDRECVEKKERC